jgi:hypothetical protein
VTHRLLGALLACVALTAACGTSKTAPREPSAPGVSVAVTADWGTTVIAEGSGPPGRVIDATNAVTATTTTYGGRFVSAIAGQAGDGERDWLFRVNGVEADIGAADVRVAADDRIWWDLHRWPGRVHVPLAVGEWPAPFDRGYPGTDFPVSADPPLADALRGYGLAVAEPAATAGARVLVGADRDLRARDADWAAAAADPAAAGLTAWIDDGRVFVWIAAEGRAVPVPNAVAVAVGTTIGRTSDSPPLLAVSGTTATAALRAAEAIAADADVLRRAFAVCFDATGTPVCTGGRGGIVA